MLKIICIGSIESVYLGSIKKKENKPIMIMVTYKYCPECRYVKKVLYKDKDIKTLTKMVIKQFPKAKKKDLADALEISRNTLYKYAK